MSGSVAVYKTGGDGGLACLSDFIQYSGTGVDKVRQSGPHAHAAIFNKDTKQLYVCDLGLDRVIVYSLDTERGKLAEDSMLQIKTAPGAGPRYLEFRYDMKFAYLINELDSTVTALRNDQAEKKLVSFQTVSTLPEGFNGKSDAADLHITQSGSFLYASNRGHDSIGCFRIDQDTGTLESLGHIPCGGRTPRNFLIDPAGRYLIVANQDSNLLNVFSINENTGMLDFTGNTAGISNPVCIRTQS